MLLIASEEELIKCSKEPDEIKRLNSYDLLAESIQLIEADKRVTKPIISRILKVNPDCQNLDNT